MSGSPVHDRLLQWLASSGTEITSKLGLQAFDGEGMGAVALADIAEGEILFRLPRELVLSVQNAPLLALLSEAEQQALGSGWAPLILAMMYEHLKGDRSSWAPYFASLPTVHDALMYWSDVELQQLQASAVKDKIGRDQAEQDAAAYTLELFHQMGSCILSRSFTVLPPGAGENEDSDEEEEQESVAAVAMVPLADALNAKSGMDNARLFYESPTHLEMRATQDIAAGEQILNTYGDNPNSDLLRRYGHVDLDNPFDVVELSADLCIKVIVGDGGAKAEQLAQRVDWALDHGIDDSYALSLDELVPDELVAITHLLRLPAAEYEKVAKRGKLRAPEPAEDGDLARCLLRIVTARKEEYVTTLEADDALLADTSLPLRTRMAIVVRRGEKAILRHTKAHLQEAIRSQPKPAKKAKRS